MERCHISLGGNLGSVSRTFDQVLGRLDDSAGKVVAVSRYLATSPVGDDSGGEFLNAAAVLETSLSPAEFLKLLHMLESETGRVRQRHWGPRSLDLDLLFYGSHIVESPVLTVPHPAAWYRRFVLDPLVEIAPELIHPVKQVTVQTLWQRLQNRPLKVALAGGTGPGRNQMARSLEIEFPQVQFADWPKSRATKVIPVREPTFIVWLGPTESASDAASAIGPARDSSLTMFEQLPLLPRVDATFQPDSALVFVRHLLRSALG